MLDNLEQIIKLDSKNMLGSLKLLSNQAEEVAAAAASLKFSASYKKIDKIMVLGMGCSALAAHIIKSVYFEELKAPIEIINGYHIPAYVNKNTLALISSYSGTTEEALFAMKEAQLKKAKITAITSGGQLQEWCEAQKIPALIFTTENNPCGSPRMGLGYSLFGLLILFSKLGMLSTPVKQLAAAVEVIQKYDFLYGTGNLAENNLAKQWAQKSDDKSVWYVGAEHLSGSAHAAANQMNENAKRFAGYFLLPEMNHHLLEGLLHPKHNLKDLLFIFLESNLYDERVQKRFAVTRQVLEKNKIAYAVYDCQEKDKFLQACETLVFFSYLSYYLALVEGIDPTAIPFVDFLKEELKK